MNNEAAFLFNPYFYIEYSNEKQPKNYSGASHFHHHYEIFYLMENDIMYHINDSVYYIEPGTMVIIPPNTIHTTQYLNNSIRKRILLNFSTEYIQPFLSDDSDLLNRLHIPPFYIEKIEQKKQSPYCIPY